MGHSPFAINFARSFIKKVIINCAREWPELSIHHRKFQNVGAKGPPPPPILYLLMALFFVNLLNLLQKVRKSPWIYLLGNELDY